MFINISNHPSTKWTDKQKEAAEKLGGEILDIPFPQINPLATAEEVRKMAENLSADIFIMSGEGIVHLMGEQSFCYALSRFLLQRGVSVVVSTTERVAVENPDGSKTAQFNFVQFRELR